MREFEYLKAKSIGEVVSLLGEHGKKACLLAGGSDLLTDVRLRIVEPQYLIDLKSILGMDSIQYDEKEGLSLGALATLQAIADSPVIREKCPILSQATSQMASHQIRNRATVGGNICHGTPSADTAPPLIALGAKLTISGPAGERIVLAEDFFKGPGLTVLSGDEILTQIQVPPLTSRTAGVYLKGTLKRAMDLALVGVAVVVTLGNSGDTCDDIKIALGAVAPTPIRAKEAEKECRGKKLDSSVIERVAKVTRSEAAPISDVRCSAEYRSDLIETLTERALTQAWGMAKNGGTR